jgi:hypothetical protein
MSWLTDLAAVLRGVRRVNSALAEHQRRECEIMWRNSSIREAAVIGCRQASVCSRACVVSLNGVNK